MYGSALPRYVCVGSAARHPVCEWVVVAVSSVSTPGRSRQDCERYVEQLLELFDKFSALVRDAFHNDPRFLTSRDKAFKELVNDTSVFK